MGFKLALSTALLFIFINESQAGILADLEDGSHTWTSTADDIYSATLAMTDTFSVDGIVSFDYEFSHFIGAPGQTFRAKSGEGELEVGSLPLIEDYTFSTAESVEPKTYTRTGNVSNKAVSIGDTFRFLATIASPVHSIIPTATLQITNFTFTPSSSESMEESAVPEPGSLALLALALPVFLVSRKSLKLSR